MRRALQEELFSEETSHPQNHESALLAEWLRSVKPCTDADRIMLVNLFVTLKSKHLVILVGRKGSGKIALLESLARILTTSNPVNCQKLIGHAWWAERSDNLAYFMQVQTRFNTWKILALMREANLSENWEQALIILMTRISPAEVNGYFSQMAFQLQHQRVMRLPCAHLASPIPYPDNLFMLATMDAIRFDWFDENILSEVAIVHWHERELTFSPGFTLVSQMAASDTEFLSSCIRDEQEARLKLQRLIGWQMEISHPLLEVENLLMNYGVKLPTSTMGDVNVYLANAWSKEGNGLFTQSPAHNMNIALDLAISQVVLPRGWETIHRSAALRKGLTEVLSDQYPYAGKFLNRLDISYRR
jgi:energy-coupling factor transporter ATP-binding protein EcfA2